VFWGAEDADPVARFAFTQDRRKEREKTGKKKFVEDSGGSEKANFDT